LSGLEIRARCRERGTWIHIVASSIGVESMQERSLLVPAAAVDHVVNHSPDHRSVGIRAARRVGALMLLAAVVLPSCVTEIDPGPIVELPVSVVRFIDEPTLVEADKILVEAARQFRGEVVPIVNRDEHLKTVTPDKIQLINRGVPMISPPVTLNFRDMLLKAREQIEVRFSDKPLQVPDPADAVAVLVIADGIAHMEGAGYELTSHRIVIRNDEVRAFDENGEPWPLPPALRR